MSNSRSSSQKNVTLDNIKKQFVQDCLVLFEGYVYKCSLDSIAYAKAGTPIDKDGFPTPATVSQLPSLIDKMVAGYETARRNFIQRVSGLELKAITQEKVQDVEIAE